MGEGLEADRRADTQICIIQAGGIVTKCLVAHGGVTTGGVVLKGERTIGRVGGTCGVALQGGKAAGRVVVTFSLAHDCYVPTAVLSS